MVSLLFKILTESLGCIIRVRVKEIGDHGISCLLTAVLVMLEETHCRRGYTAVLVMVGETHCWGEYTAVLVTNMEVVEIRVTRYILIFYIAEIWWILVGISVSHD